MIELRELYSGKSLGEKEFDELPKVDDIVNGLKVAMIVHIEHGTPVIFLKNSLINDWPENENL